MVAATVLTGTGWGVSISISPLLFTDLGLSDTAIGLLGSCFAAGLIVAALPAGALVRRSGPRASAILALAIDALALVLLPQAHSLPVLAALRCLDGACTTLLTLATELLLLADAGDGRARGLGLQTVALGAGFLTGPLIAHAGLGAWSVPQLYRVTFALLLIGAAVHATSGRTDGPARGATSIPVVALLELVRTARASIAAAFTFGVFQATLLAIIPVFLLRDHRASRASLVLLPALFIAGTLVGTPPLTRAADRDRGVRWLVRLSLWAAAMVALFIWVRTPVQLWAVAAASGPVTALGPIANARLIRIGGPALLGASNAAFQLAYALGRFAGPLALGAILDVLGGPALLGSLAALWVACALVALFERHAPALAAVTDLDSP